MALASHKRSLPSLSSKRAESNLSTMPTDSLPQIAQDGRDAHHPNTSSQKLHNQQALSQSSQPLNSNDVAKANTEKKLPRLAVGLESQPSLGSIGATRLQFKDKQSEMEYINKQAGLLYERVQKRKQDERSRRAHQ